MHGGSNPFIDLVTIIAIGAMLIGGLGMVLFSGEKSRRSTVVFIMGSAVVLASALVTDAEFRHDAHMQIAKALVGLICAIIGALKLKFERRDVD